MSVEVLQFWGVNLLWAAAIFLVGRQLSQWASMLLKRVLIKSKVDSMLADFVQHISYWVLVLVVVIAALDRLGVNTTSLVALIGAAGLAVGLALKDSLQNFAAGVMLLMFRPFAKGDFVEAGGTQGVVVAIGIFCTEFNTPDNQKVIVPNGAIYSGVIVNVTAHDTRRLDLTVGISYSDNPAQAKEILERILVADSRVLADPAPVVAVAELADSSVNLVVRPWIKTEDYWQVRFDLLEAIKRELDAAGISIPFPQLDLHMQPSE